MSKTNRTPPPCPKCGSAEQVVPVVHGMPTEEGKRSAARGEVWLSGGCCIDPDAWAWYCRSCREGFGRLADERPELFRR